MEVEDQASLLLQEYTAQIPAHAAYVMTTIFAMIAGPIGIVLTNFSYKVYLAVGYEIVLFFILSYSGSRLYYYITLQGIVNNLLGMQGFIVQQRYSKLMDALINEETTTIGISGAVNGVLLYLVKYKKLKTWRVLLLQVAVMMRGVGSDENARVWVEKYIKE